MLESYIIYSKIRTKAVNRYRELFSRSSTFLETRHFDEITTHLEENEGEKLVL